LREAIIGSVLEGDRIGITMNFANIGETAGVIVRSMVDVEVIEMGTDRLYLHGSVEAFNEVGPTPLGPGMERLVPYEHLHKRPNSDKLTPIWNAEKFAVKTFVTRDGATGQKIAKTRYTFVIDLVGQIVYVDGSDPPIPRRTAFRRRLKPERQRFYRIEDEPDLDYAD
jgi:hypothetical protein